MKISWMPGKRQKIVVLVLCILWLLPWVMILVGGLLVDLGRCVP